MEVYIIVYYVAVWLVGYHSYGICLLILTDCVGFKKKVQEKTKRELQCRAKVVVGGGYEEGGV